MTTTNITSFRKNLYTMMENAIRFNETAIITTKEGNAVVMSEEEYNGMVESLYLNSIPGMREKLLDGLHTDLSETISEDEVTW